METKTKSLNKALEAVTSIIEDNRALIVALKEAGEHFSMFKQRLDGRMT